MGISNFDDENVVSTSCVGAVVGATVGGTTVGAGSVATGAQAASNIHPSINIETSNLYVFMIFSFV